MYFRKPMIQSNMNWIQYLAPIPVYKRQFDDDAFHERLFHLGFTELNDAQRRMGQELPGKYDQERYENYNDWYGNQEEWVEDGFPPIGSRFSVPPNNFLELDNEDVKEMRRRIVEAFDYTLKHIEMVPGDAELNPIITESWAQWYEPHHGRGHNKHNHCRWDPNEAPYIGFSGGYYLSDGEPFPDHTYSGAFVFHIRDYDYYIRPKKGMLILWPYDIVHSVTPFYGKSHRCVVNFNIQCDNPNFKK